MAIASEAFNRNDSVTASYSASDKLSTLAAWVVSSRPPSPIGRDARIYDSVLIPRNRRRTAVRAKLIWNEFEKWGHQSRAKVGGGKIFGRASPLFGSKAQLVVLVSAFVMVSTVWLVNCLLFFYSRCPRAQPIVKVWKHVPLPCSVEPAPLLLTNCDTTLHFFSWSDERS